MVCGLPFTETHIHSAQTMSLAPTIHWDPILRVVHKLTQMFSLILLSHGPCRLRPEPLQICGTDTPRAGCESSHMCDSTPKNDHSRTQPVDTAQMEKKKAQQQE